MQQAMQGNAVVWLASLLFCTAMFPQPMSAAVDAKHVAMQKTISDLLVPGKGILAADESFGTMSARLSAVGLSDDQQTRTAWRQVILSTPGLEQYISGIILHEETLMQLEQPVQKPSKAHADGDEPQNAQPQHRSIQLMPRLVDRLMSIGIHIGIKVDLGTEQLQGACSGEVFTKGLEDLEERACHYASLNATFAKWRAVFHVKATSHNSSAMAAAECLETTGNAARTTPVSDDSLGNTAAAGMALLMPSRAALNRNAQDLAQYAAICQKCGLVPIVEPEVLVSDGDHDLAVSQWVTDLVLDAVAHALAVHPDVHTNLVIIKPNMVLPGSNSGKKPSHEQVAAATLASLAKLQARLPSLPGVAFLSGGQSAEDATLHLMHINIIAAQQQQQAHSLCGEGQQGGERLVMTFSYGRALLQTALQSWSQTVKSQESGLCAGLGGNSRSCKLGHVTSRDDESYGNGDTNIAEQGCFDGQEAAQAELLKWCLANSRASKGLQTELL